MNCRTTIDLLADFADGELAPDEDRALRAHLANCPRCTEFIERYRATGRLFREATEATLPDDLEQRLLDFLAKRG